MAPLFGPPARYKPALSIAASVTCCKSCPSHPQSRLILEPQALRHSKGTFLRPLDRLVLPKKVGQPFGSFDLPTKGSRQTDWLGLVTGLCLMDLEANVTLGYRFEFTLSPGTLRDLLDRACQKCLNRPSLPCELVWLRVMDSSWGINSWPNGPLSPSPTSVARNVRSEGSFCRCSSSRIPVGTGQNHCPSFPFSPGSQNRTFLGWLAPVAPWSPPALRSWAACLYQSTDCFAWPPANWQTALMSWASQL